MIEGCHVSLPPNSNGRRPYQELIWLLSDIVMLGMGGEVLESETTERAVELLREGRRALVFCEVNLGDGDNFAVLQQFVAEKPEARVVIVTKYNFATGALVAVASGAKDYGKRTLTCKLL